MLPWLLESIRSSGSRESGSDEALSVDIDSRTYHTVTLRVLGRDQRGLVVDDVDSDQLHLCNKEGDEALHPGDVKVSVERDDRPCLSVGRGRAHKYQFVRLTAKDAYGQRLSGLEEFLASQVPGSSSGLDDSSRSTGVSDLRGVENSGRHFSKGLLDFDSPGFDGGLGLPGELLPPGHDSVSSVSGGLGGDLDHLGGLIGGQLERRQAVERLDFDELHRDIGLFPGNNARQPRVSQGDVVLGLEVLNDRLPSAVVLGKGEFLSGLERQPSKAPDLVRSSVSHPELGAKENLSELLDIVLRQRLEIAGSSGRTAETTTTSTTSATITTTTSRSTSTTSEATAVATEKTFGDLDEGSGSYKGRVSSVELDGRVSYSRSEGSER